MKGHWGEAIVFSCGPYSSWGFGEKLMMLLWKLGWNKVSTKTTRRPRKTTQRLCEDTKILRPWDILNLIWELDEDEDENLEKTVWETVLRQHKMSYTGIVLVSFEVSFWNPVNMREESGKYGKFIEGFYIRVVFSCGPCCSWRFGYG